MNSDPAPGIGFAGGRVQGALSLVARVALGLVLISAGALKVADPNAAITAVTAYQILPSGLATIVGYGLPFFEIMLGLLLVVGLATRASAATAGVLMVVFIAGVSSAWARGLSIDCGCFGGGGETDNPAYLPEILRDLLFLGLACWLVAFPASLLALDRLGWFGTGTHGLIDDLIEDADETDDTAGAGEEEDRPPESMDLRQRLSD